MALDRNRGQSEIIGSLLLVGVITVGITSMGGFAAINYMEQANTNDILMDCSIEIQDNTILITHVGGESADVSELKTIFRNESSQSQRPFQITEGDGDGLFETGESAVFDSPSVETEILLVTDNKDICNTTIDPGLQDEEGDDEEGDDEEGDDEEGDDEEGDDEEEE